jgi:hypothetical protein
MTKLLCDEVLAQAGQAKLTAARFLKLEGAHLALGVMYTIAPVQFVSFLGRQSARAHACYPKNGGRTRRLAVLTRAKQHAVSYQGQQWNSTRSAIFWRATSIARRQVHTSAALVKFKV